jgi:membrane protease YdiL (CAAX protease family)
VRTLVGVVAVTLAVAPAVALVMAALGRPLPDPAAFALYTGIGPVGIVGVVVFALVVNGFGEEMGWRGFAAERLLRTHGLTRTAVLVAGMWGGWHLPLFWVLPSFRELGPAGTVGWAVGLLAGSVVLTALLRGSGGSVLLVAAWHIAFNVGSATEATQGLPAAVISTLVMAAAVFVVVHELRARPGPPGRPGRASQ